MKIRCRSRRTLSSWRRQSMASHGWTTPSFGFTLTASTPSAAIAVSKANAVIASNPPFGSGGSGSSSSPAHLPTSARFHGRAPGPVSGRLSATADGGTALRRGFPSPFGHRHSLLGHPVPARELGSPYGRLTAAPTGWLRTLTGFPCSARMRLGWCRVPSLPRRRRCPHGRGRSEAAACRFPAAEPLLLGCCFRLRVLL